ncbi:tripartite tricarboxylate transporter TctB family protein [Oceanobacillus sp. CFH 90083]|uniref:tripartite tricarboxylate transporter TctB family protein n=1 Tax=Oceanobacillus sp. CFH 90083 TaxID=2592336 RepID=UPI00128BBE79|nr:tripartite tricarboxylate transporter TctB family protein [Oceanobacillus sp. CFH 90083]
MKISVNKGLSIVLIIIAAGYLIMAYQLPEYIFVPVDADLVPKLLGYALLILSIFFFFSKDIDTDEQKAKRVIPKNDFFILLGILAMILLYITVLEVIGFVIMTALFIIASSRFLGYKNWTVLLLTSLLFAGSAYSLFNYGLAIRLPAGILPF